MTSRWLLKAYYGEILGCSFVLDDSRLVIAARELKAVVWPDGSRLDLTCELLAHGANPDVYLSRWTALLRAALVHGIAEAAPLVTLMRAECVLLGSGPGEEIMIRLSMASPRDVNSAVVRESLKNPPPLRRNVVGGEVCL